MANKTTVGQRFTELINHLGLSKNAFAMSLDKTATVIQHLVDERNKPGFDLLCKVFEIYPNVSKDWLLEGRDPMLTDETEAATATPDPAPASKAPAKPAPTPAAPAPELPLSPAPAAAPPPTTPKPAEAPAASATGPVAAPVPPAAPAAPEPAAALAAPVPVASPAATPEPSWQTALYTQQMAHQLAMAEQRNQHLLDQQRLMQQMLDLVQQQLA